MSTTPPLGVQEAFGVSLETVFGTPVNPAVWFRCVSNGLRRKQPPQMPAGPSGSHWNRYDGTRPRVWVGAPRVEGPVVLEMEFQDFPIFFTTMIGTPTTQVDTPVAGTHTHTWTATAGVPGSTPVSFTAAHINGQEDLQYTGCHVRGMRIAFQPTQENDGLIQVTLDIIGFEGGAAEVPDDTTEGFSTAPFVQWRDLTFLYNASPSQAFGSLSELPVAEGPLSGAWSFTNPYRIGPAAANSTAGIREPVFNGKREAGTTMSRDFINDDFFDHYHRVANDELTDMFCSHALRFQSSENITGSTKYEMRFHSPTSLVADHDSPYEGGDEIRAEQVAFQAWNDGSNDPLVVTVINGTAVAAYT